MSYKFLHSSLQEDNNGISNGDNAATELDELSSATVTKFTDGSQDVTLAANDSGDTEGHQHLLLSPLGEYTDYEEILRVVGFGIGQVLLLLGTAVALTSDSIELLALGFALPILNTPSELNLSSWQNGLLSSVIFMGSMVGSLVWGGIADISGRRLTLIISLTINGIFGAASAFSPNFTVLVLLRFISGIGVGGSIPVTLTYLSEFIMAKYRGPSLGVLSLSWVIGALVCGGLAWGLLPMDLSLSLGGSYSLHNWRIFLLLCGIPPFIGAILFIVMPESPRFLLEVGDEERPIKILRRLYNVNHFYKRDKKSPFPVTSIKLSLLDSEAFESKNRISSYRQRFVAVANGSREILRRIVKLFRRNLIRPTVILMITYFCLSFGSYGVTLWYPSYIDRLSRESLDNTILHEDCNHTLYNYTINSSDQSLDDLFCSCPSTNYRNSTFYNMTLSSWWMMDSSLYGIDIMEGHYEWVWFENVTMDTVTFSHITLRNAFICNSSWNNVEFVDVTFDNCSFCGINSKSVSFLSSTFVNSSLNTVILDELPDTEINKIFSVTNNRTQCDDVISRPTGTCLTDPTEVDLSQEYLYDFVIAGSAFPGNVVSAIAVYFIVRSYCLSFSFLLSTITVFLLFLVHTEIYAVLILCMFKAITIPAWNVSSLIVAEIYPTSLRTTAFGVLLLVARIGAIIGTYVFGAFTNTSQISVPILLTAVVLFVACVASILLPKTTRKTALQ